MHASLFTPNVHQIAHGGVWISIAIQAARSGFSSSRADPWRPRTGIERRSFLRVRRARRDPPAPICAGLLNARSRISGGNFYPVLCRWVNEGASSCPRLRRAVKNKSRPDIALRNACRRATLTGGSRQGRQSRGITAIETAAGCHPRLGAPARPAGLAGRPMHTRPSRFRRPMIGTCTLRDARLWMPIARIPPRILPVCNHYAQILCLGGGGADAAAYRDRILLASARRRSFTAID